MENEKIVFLCDTKTRVIGGGLYCRANSMFLDCLLDYINRTISTALAWDKNTVHHRKY